MTKLRKGYVAVNANLMMHCDPDITRELFGDSKVCAGCYLSTDESCDCIVSDWEVIVPEHTVAIIKMNQVKRK